VGINVFDFNRCNGKLTLVDSFYNGTLSDSILPPLGIESSSDGRYMYLFATSVIYQIDLQSLDLQNSFIEVAKWDGFLGPFPTDFVHGQLAPDGKIYVNSGSGNYYISVIEFPDNDGLNCNAKQHHIQTPTFISGLPRNVNYRLGTANCNGTSINPISFAVSAKLYPNPTTNNVHVEYNGIAWEAYKTVKLQIFDAIGSEIYTTDLPMYSMLHRINLNQWSKGIYFYAIKGDSRILANGKFVKE
jgi:hypothetical protein